MQDDIRMFKDSTIEVADDLGLLEGKYRS